MELYQLLRMDFCARITAVKRNGMTAWIVEWNLNYLCCAEVGEMN